MTTQRVEPNFWCSAEYFDKAGVSEALTPGGAIAPMADGYMIAPPLFPDGRMSSELLGDGLWADVDGYTNCCAKPQELDKEYIYDPKAFLSLDGKHWKLMRQKLNVLGRYLQPYVMPGHPPVTIYPMNPLIQSFNYISVEAGSWDHTAAVSIIVEWLHSKDSIEDSEVLEQYINDPANIKVLKYKDSVIGVNIWDESWKYINYRYMFASREIPGLSWLMRYRFYMDPEIQGKNKLVNDGGVLDSPSLAFHKDKLNPLIVRQRHSWSKS